MDRTIGGTGRSKRDLRNCTRGIAALEFVFLAPALLMLAFALKLGWFPSGGNEDGLYHLEATAGVRVG